MPDFCVAYGCSNERSKKTNDKGITFHRFPSDVERRRAWTLALRRNCFEPKPRSLLCSCHFRQEDFDRTGQTVRLRDGVIPSIFKFPGHLSKRQSSRSSSTSKKTGEQCPPPRPHTPTKQPDQFDPSDFDHPYFLDPVKAKQKLTESQDQVEKLRRELRNARDREKRQEMTVRSLLEDLKKNSKLTEELQEKLDKVHRAKTNGGLQ